MILDKLLGQECSICSSHVCSQHPKLDVNASSNTISIGSASVDVGYLSQVFEVILKR